MSNMAGLAQSAEHEILNLKVAGLIPAFGSMRGSIRSRIHNNQNVYTTVLILSLSVGNTRVHMRIKGRFIKYLGWSTQKQKLRPKITDLQIPNFKSRETRLRSFDKYHIRISNSERKPYLII